MKHFYLKAVLFWFVLLMLALINATIRETTYKPLLTPHIGMWAHQISSITGILFFFMAIYVFLKSIKDNYSLIDLVFAGLLWILMTIAFETIMNVFIRNLSLNEILQAYYFWTGETWIFVLLSLVISPLIVYKMLNPRDKKKFTGIF